MADTNPKIFPQEAKPIAELKEKETIASLDSLSPKQTKENKFNFNIKKPQTLVDFGVFV